MEIISHGLLSLFVLVLWIQGLADGSDVTQTDILWEKEGEDARMVCSHKKGVGYNQMYWYRQLPGETMRQVVLTVAGSKPIFEPDFREEKYSTTKPEGDSGTFTVKNLQPGDKGLYFCAVSRGGGGAEAYFGGGTRLTVLETDHEVTKPTVDVLPPSPNECRNKKDPSKKKKTLVCVASKFYPDHVSVSWQVNGEDVTEGVATDNAALRDGKTYTITSRLRVSAKEWYNPGIKFTCIVAFYNGSDTINVPGSILGVKDTGGTMSREKYLKITQSAKLSYGVLIAKSCIYGAFVAFLVWKIQGSAGKQNH